MNFDELNKNYTKAGISEKEINEKAKTIEELASFSVKYDNPFYFEDFHFSDIPNTNLFLLLFDLDQFSKLQSNH